MPPADQMQDHGRLMRSLAYGRDKTKKTWWALQAAEAGFNVIHLDGDESATIVRRLSPEAQKRVLVVNLSNTQDKAVFARFIGLFCKPGKPFLWDEQEKNAYPVEYKRNPNHSYIYFDRSKCTNNDLIVIDSWTSLAGSTLIEFANDQGIDLTQIERESDGFAAPNFQSRFLDFVLNQIKTFNAHTIVVGHEMVYEKFKGTGRDKKIVGTFTQPISSTGPHGQKLGKFFENVFRFTRPSDIKFMIDAGGDDSVAGGSRFYAPQKYDWKDITPQAMMAALGATGAPAIVDPDFPEVKFYGMGAIYIPPGSAYEILKGKVPLSNTPAQVAVPAQPQVLDAGGKKVSALDMLRNKAKQA